MTLKFERNGPYVYVRARGQEIGFNVLISGMRQAFGSKSIMSRGFKNLYWHMKQAFSGRNPFFVEELSKGVLIFRVNLSGKIITFADCNEKIGSLSVAVEDIDSLPEDIRGVIYSTLADEGLKI